MFARPEAPVRKYLLAGSIIEYATGRCTVWGSGMLSAHDLVSPRAELLAVRGPLTRRRALECGVDCPDVFGDPALLLPQLYHPPVRPRQGVGLVPHFSEKARVMVELRTTPELRFIDIQGGVEHVIDQLTGCELVASSSLHGLIAAQAYGIPAVWLKFRDLPPRDDTKFHDYLISVGAEPAPPAVMESRTVTADRVARCRPLAAPSINLEPLWRTCPWRHPA